MFLSRIISLCQLCAKAEDLQEKDEFQEKISEEMAVLMRQASDAFTILGQKGFEKYFEYDLLKENLEQACFTCKENGSCCAMMAAHLQSYLSQTFHEKVEISVVKKGKVIFLPERKERA